MAANKGSWALLSQLLSQQVGIMENPIGSNCQVYSHDLHRPCEFWCQDFAGDMGLKAGINMFGAEKTAYTPAAAAAYQKAGRYGKVPRAGAQGFVYHHDIGRIGHTFWVIAVSADGKSIVTTEGNSNNDGSRNGIGVFRLNRKVDASLTFGYPLYKDTALPPKPSAPPAKPTAKPVARPTLRQGDHNNFVLEMQHDLVRHGIKVALDGDFGPATKKALIAFQVKAFPGNKTAQDGVCGNATWAKLA